VKPVEHARGRQRSRKLNRQTVSSPKNSGFSIFPVFFKLPIHKVVSSRVASFVKVPYVNGRVDVYKTVLNLYNKIYNVIYCAKKDEHKTYFYVKNNSIRYYNRTDIPVFTIDVINGSHKIHDLRNTQCINKDSESIVLITEQGQQYLVSNRVEDSDGVYVAVIDITTGKEIYIEPREDETKDLYFNFMRPVGNSIIPIIRIQREVIVVDLIDVSDNKNYHISWGLTELQFELSEELFENNDEEDLPDDLVRALKKEEMEYIKIIGIDKIQYKYANYRDNINYINEISIHFMFEAKAGGYECGFHNVILNITLDMEGCYIEVYLDFSKTSMTIDGYHVAEMKDYLHEKKLLSEKVNFPGVIHNNSISDILYSNKCYIIWHDKDGVKISKIRVDGDEFNATSNTAGLYRYKDYLFILRKSRNRNLVIANTRSDSIAVWSPEADKIKCMEGTLTYNFHYLSASDVFAFISSRSYCLLLIDRKSIDNILNQNENCHEILNDAVRVFDLDSIVRGFIYTYYDWKNVIGSKIIGYYVNEWSNSLHVIASYDLEQTRHIGLFECKIFKNGLNVNLLDYVSSDKIYSNSFSKGSNIENMKLYSVKESSLKDLDLAYSDDNRIIDISHNRRGISLQDFMLRNLELYKVVKKSVFKYNELIILEHTIREHFMLDYAIWFCFIVSGLTIVEDWGV
jgi:hypothetical protein